MICNMRIILLASAALAAFGLLVGAPASAQGVKIGILNDQSGVYADYGGKGSIEAAKMAIEDFGGSVCDGVRGGEQNGDWRCVRSGGQVYGEDGQQ